jgi:hypothetical protein
MPPLDQALVLAIAAAMVALFVWNRLRCDPVALPAHRDGFGDRATR